MNRLMRLLLILTLAMFVITLSLPTASQAASNAQGADTPTATATATETPTATLAPTSTNTPEPTAVPFGRPQIVVKNYSISGDGSIRAGQSFIIDIQLYNAGQRHATNIQVSFPSGDLIPRDTGGVVVVGEVAPGNHHTLSQPMTASASVTGPGLLTTDALVTYYDQQGTSYTEKFTLAIPVAGPAYGGPVLPTRTPTPVTTNRPQLIVTSYNTDTNPLQPGSLFNISMELRNVGTMAARNITMIVGGGSLSVDANGTPQPGGVSGGSGEFTYFAPIGSSNVQQLGDIPAGGALSVGQGLIVNVSTTPGAYPLKISFISVDEKGNIYKDDQVVTLLVYSLPRVGLSFYRDPGMFFIGQPNTLPVQVVNLGNKTAVLGNMRVVVNGATLENGQVFIGALEPGGYFTLDSIIYPDAPGTLSLDVTLEYTDDFNQPRTITQTLSVEVMDQQMPPEIDPGMGGGGGGMEEPVIVTEETFLQKAWRFILGLFGLDSAAPQQSTPPFEEGVPSEGVPVPRPVSPGGKG